MTGQYPPCLIIPVSDTLDTFKEDVELSLGFMLCEQQLQEIVTQIFEILLDGGHNVLSRLNALPNFNLMVGEQAFTALQRDMIQRCTRRMAMDIVQLVSNLGGYKQGFFPYVFDSFLGSDVVLMHLPY